MEKEKTYDKIKYNDAYNKEHYKRIGAYFDAEAAAALNSYCIQNGYNKSEFIKNCVNYCIKKGIKFVE